MAKIGEKKISIFLVEDHPIFRKGLAQLIESDPNISVCGEAEDYNTALQGIKKTSPDLALIDISLKESSGIELIKDLKKLHPEVAILCLSMHDENIYAERILRAGAKGYLMKDEAPETVIEAIKQVMDGRVYLSDSMSSRLLNKIIDGKGDVDSSPVDVLSDRELEVYKLIGEGMNNRDIARNLNISVKTVENHRAHIKEKLGLQSAIELIQQAALWAKENN